MIETKSISKSFDGKTVLKDVDIVFEDGKITGLYGASGCGKSTLAKMLCGVYAPTGGNIFLGGTALFEHGVYNRKIGKQIQIVWQQPYSALDPQQKICSALWETARFAHPSNSRGENSALVARTLDLTNLGKDVIKSFPNEISGGEAQRVNLAKCLLLGAKWIIFDEATSMSDVSTQANILSFVKSAVEDKLFSAIFISHDKPLVDFFCDSVYVYDRFDFKEKTQ